MVTLPTIEWGSPASPQRALLIHGINGSAATWWHLAEDLARDGWRVTAVDLRGHGDAARASSYAFVDYVDDLPGADWDLVVGHSLGGAIGTLAASRSGFTRALVLLDPVLLVPDDESDDVHAEEVDELGKPIDDIRASQPNWDERDIVAKAEAAARADRAMVDGTFAQNRPWDVVAIAQSLPVRTLILGADPAMSGFFPAELADRISAVNPRVTYRLVSGSGHSVHRDKPQATLAAVQEWLTSAGAPLP